jgi:predicted dehydrogenase
MKTVKVGLIGLGGISRRHIRNLEATPEARISAICDTRPEMLKEKKAMIEEDGKSRVRTFGDYRRMLDETKLDAVVIITPHDVHYEQAKEILGRGLHCLVEKPLTNTLSHSRELVRLAKKKNLALAVAYDQNYTSDYLYAREIIASGKLGEVMGFTGELTQNWIRIMNPERKSDRFRFAWRSDPKIAGGGFLNDSGSHLQAAILWLTGLIPKEVLAFVDNCGTRTDINIDASLRCSRLSDQADVSGTLAFHGNVPHFSVQFSIWGTKGNLYIRNWKVWHLKGRKYLIRPRKSLPAPSDPDKNFIDAILGRDEVKCDGTLGAKVVALTRAIYSSAKKRAPVRVSAV